MQSFVAWPRPISAAFTNAHSPVRSHSKNALLQCSALSRSTKLPHNLSHTPTIKFATHSAFKSCLTYKKLRFSSLFALPEQKRHLNVCRSTSNERTPDMNNSNNNGSGGEWTTSILLFGLWAGLLFYVFVLSPNQTPCECGQVFFSMCSSFLPIKPRGRVVTVGLPPAWVDVSEEIGSNMQRARTKMVKLAKAHAKVLMPSFGDAKEDQHVIDVLSQEIIELLKKCEKKLQQLSGHGASDDMNVQKNVQRFLATDLQSLSMEFRKRQTAYLKRIQQQDGTNGFDIEMNFNQKRLRKEDDSFDSGFNKQQMTKLKKNEALTDERQREISQIVQSVSDLAQIMKDLSTLVIDQGTIVDRIDYNIQNVSASIQQGLKHLEKAERSQRNGGMVMCATVLIFMCLFMIVLLIIKETFF